MPTRDTAPIGAPCWVDLMTSDTDRVQGVRRSQLKRIGDLGGATVVAAEDTPYGRLATATDPNGAQFKLVAPNEMMPARS